MALVGVGIAYPGRVDADDGGIAIQQRHMGGQRIDDGLEGACLKAGPGKRRAGRKVWSVHAGRFGSVMLPRVVRKGGAVQAG